MCVLLSESYSYVDCYCIELIHCRLSREREREMMREGKESVRSSSSPSSSVPASASSYSLKPVQLYNEDILFCIDADVESQTEMKIPGPNGRLYTRLESIKQAILLFINSKLYINPHHRFGFAALGKSASLVPLLYFRLLLHCYGCL